MPHELHFTGCQIEIFDKSVFVPYVLQILAAQLLDGSGLEPPTHNVESENTRTFNMINDAAGSPSNIILDQRDVFQSCKICIVVRVLAIDQCFSVVVVQTVSNLAFLGSVSSLSFF